MQLLENANKKIKAELRKTDGVYTKKRYQQISVMLNETARKLRDSIGINLDSTELIEAELEYQRNQLNSAYKGTDLKGFDFTLPDEKQIRSAVQFAPFCDGANYEQYLNNIYNGFYDTWDNELRTGYILGIPTNQIIKNVMGTVAKNGEVAQIGSIEKIRQSIERNTRTYLQSMASTARNTLYKENESLFSGYKYVCTLDRRTCIVCMSDSNKIFKNIEDAPRLARHYNCRCQLLAQVKGLDGILDSDTQASENGQVPAEWTYEEWLKRQPDDVQRDVLGKTRYEIFKNGGKIGGFVNDGKVIPLDKLKYDYVELHRNNQSFSSINNYRISNNIYEYNEKISECESYIQNKFSAKVVSYNGIDVRCAEEINLALEKNLSKYPLLKNQIKYIIFDKQGCESIRNDFISLYGDINDSDMFSMVNSIWDKEIEKLSSNIAAKFTYRNKITGNKVEGLYIGNIFSDYDSYMDKKNNLINSNFHSKTKKTVEASINHEIGHFLTDLEDLYNDKKLNALYNYLKNHNLIESYVGEYASKYTGEKGFEEFIAECFAEYSNSDNPGKIAMIVGRKIDKEYKKL